MFYIKTILLRRLALEVWVSNEILVAGAGVWKISSVACGFSSIDYSDYPKSLISRINKFMFFFAIAMIY